MRFEKHSFGPVLRSGRERRKVSLAQLSADTKVSPQIWKALEDNDLSRWPTRIYARSLIREYAKRVGLDPEELVSEFCRLFPQGDRRVESLVRQLAALEGHQLDWRSELLRTDGKGGRRAADRALEVPPPRRRIESVAWVVAAALDVTIVLSVSKLAAVVFATHFWPLLGLMGLTYHAISTMGMGRSVGAVLGDLAAPIISEHVGQEKTRGLPTSRGLFVE